MFNNKIRRILVDACFAIAIFFNIYYLFATHIPFMMSLSHFLMYNISSVSYTIMRFLYILIPVFLLVPPIRGEKIKRIKFSLYLMGILYILGSTWIFYFLADNPLSLLQDRDATYQYLQAHALNADYLVWDSYDLYGILFSMIEAALYIAAGYFIDKRRRVPVRLYWLTVIMSVLLPFIYVFGISGVGSFTELWLQKNVVIFASGIFTAVGLTLASKSRSVWSDVVWG